jgi:thioredoxin reductase (NADPH)
MSDEVARSTLLTSRPHSALMFSTLSFAQIARIASRGMIRQITRGEVLIDGGQTNVPLFVVKAGDAPISV